MGTQQGAPQGQAQEGGRTWPPTGVGCAVIDAADADVCNNVVAVASAEQEMSHFGERAFGSPSPPDIGPANTWHA